MLRIRTLTVPLLLIYTASWRFVSLIKYTEILPYMHKYVQHYLDYSSTDESCDFVNIIHRHEMNEFSTKTNMNTEVDRLISWFSC